MNMMVNSSELVVNEAETNKVSREALKSAVSNKNSKVVNLKAPATPENILNSIYNEI